MSAAEPRDDATERQEAAAAFARADLECTFGPSFFLGHLRRFVRDRCPDPNENLPLVQVRLPDGEILDVCHIVGVSPRWVVLAVREPAAHPDGMAIEIVPFELIRGVRICTRHSAGANVGFTQGQVPEVITAETLLTAAIAGGQRAV